MKRWHVYTNSMAATYSYSKGKAHAFPACDMGLHAVPNNNSAVRNESSSQAKPNGFGAFFIDGVEHAIGSLNSNKQRSQPIFKRIFRSIIFDCCKLKVCCDAHSTVAAMMGKSAPFFENIYVYMSIKFIFMALTHNVWPSIAIVAIFFGSTKLKHASKRYTTNDTERKREARREKEK